MSKSKGKGPAQQKKQDLGDISKKFENVFPHVCCFLMLWAMNSD